MFKKFLLIKYILTLAITLILLLNTGCKKYLSSKSDKSLAIPASLVDLQALMDDYSRINYGVGAGVTAADEYYLTESQFNELYIDEDRRMYTWKDDDVVYSKDNGWVRSYDNIYRANTVLEVISGINRDHLNKADWDNVKGEALFLRGRSFFEVAMIWAEAYDKNNSRTKLGVPLRLGTDFNVPSVRGSLEKTYRQIISDLKASIELLPNRTVHVFRASRPAVCGELARVYLSMRMYDSAMFYSSEALKEFNYLLDYNTLDTSKRFPFVRFGPEVIYETTLFMTLLPYNVVDSTVYQMYDDNDLRKALFFDVNKDGSHRFCGSYNNTFAAFGGIASDELYLMRAECFARLGKIDLALNDLNLLLRNRYLRDSFILRKSKDSKEVLEWILDERLKELLFRGLRWIDIKRLNKEGANIRLRRIVGGVEYILPPNDFRYAVAIPKDIIENSDIQQNPR